MVLFLRGDLLVLYTNDVFLEVMERGLLRYIRLR